MLFTQSVFAAVMAATSALAAPAALEQSMMATNVPAWTFEGVTRNCDEHDDVCTVKFTINNKIYQPTFVTFVTTRNGAIGASRNIGVAQTYADYTVTSGWSGQFGADKGFTTFAVVDTKNRLIAYPSYTDVQLANGNVVKPDQSYNPQMLA